MREKSGDKKKTRLVLKHPIINNDWETYLNAKLKDRQFGSGLENPSLAGLIFVLLFAALAFIEVMEDNYTLALIIICIPLFVYQFKYLLHRSTFGGRAKSFFFMLLLICAMGASTYVTVLDFYEGRLTSPNAARVICAIPDTLQRFGIETDEDLFYNTALKIAPEKDYAYIAKARKYQENHDLESAKKWYQDAYEHDSKSYLSQYELGLIFVKEGKTIEATKAFKNARSINTKFIPAYAEEAIILISRGNIEAAEAILRICEQNNSENWAVYRLRGAIRAAKNQVRDALGAYNKAIQLNPESNLLLREKSMLLLKDGKPLEALNNIEKAISSKKAEPENQYYKAAILMYITRFDEAKACLVEALNMDENYAQARAGLAYVYSELGDMKKAQEEIKKALALKSSDASVLSYNARILFIAGKYDAVISEINKAILENDYKAEYHALKAKALIKKNMTSDSKIEIDKALAIDDNDVYALQAAAAYYYSMGNYGEAENIYNRLIELSPELTRVYSELALLFNTTGDNEKSERYIAEAFSNRPEDYYNHYIAARIFKDRKMKDKALKSIEKAIQLNPGYEENHRLKDDIVTPAVKNDNTEDVFDMEASTEVGILR